ncbi:MAG TPA: hypothetical protein VK986_13655 [Tepidisphaeraceae bacterium]|nr:hypothetical protein [Tepidisphaeraceae bacterium]
MSSEDLESESGESQDPTADLDLGQGETEYVVAEEKKPISAATLVLFAIFGAAGLASYFLLVKEGPSASAAATADPKAGQVIEQFMTDKSQNFAHMQKMLRDTDLVVKQFLTYPSVTQVPLTDLRANPFQLAAADEAAKPTGKEAEREKKRKEEERQAVLRGVQNLQLQSVIASDRSKSCMINNVLYTEGQQVDAFTVEKIAPNAVIVRNGAYRFELRMQR